MQVALVQVASRPARRLPAEPAVVGTKAVAPRPPPRRIDVRRRRDKVELTVAGLRSVDGLDAGLSHVILRLTAPSACKGPLLIAVIVAASVPDTAVAWRPSVGTAVALAAAVSPSE